MHSFYVFQSDRFVVWFRRGGENWAETDVVSTFALGRNRLLEAVCRFSHHHRPSHFLPDDCDSVVILANMHAFDRHMLCDFGVIVHDQGDGKRGRNLVKLASKIGKLAKGLPFSAQLNKIDISINH